MKKTIHSKNIEIAAKKALIDRGVSIKDIAELVYEMQSPYQSDLTLSECIESVDAVLQKREIQHALLVGIELDKLAEEKKLSEPLQSLVEMDEGLFGVDETIALGAVFGYGSIAITTFGHLDKHKIGVIKKLDTKQVDGVHTFLDDLVASVAASASARLAHVARDREEQNLNDEIESNDVEEKIG
jgi:phosphatidylglycerophosphatase A